MAFVISFIMAFQCMISPVRAIAAAPRLLKPSRGR
jgi:hypothetical protein